MKRLKRKVRNILVILLCCIVTFIIGFYVQRKQNFHNEYVDVKFDVINTEVKNEASIVMVGDALMHMGLVNAYKTGKTYDYAGVFKYVGPIIKDYDLKYYNQETILGGSSLPLKGYPQFNSPQEVGDSFIKQGFNLVSLATNHTLDNYYIQGGKNIKNSLEYWKKQEDKVLAAGSYSSEEEREKEVIKEVNGITYTMLSYTEHTNGIPVPSGKSYLVNVYNKDKVKKDIEKYRDKVDVLMVAMHWGEEYTNNPTSGQKEKAKYLASLGVDLIIGCHPHVMQPMTYIDHTLVVYSLGNFVSCQSGYNKQTGLMASANIVKRTYHGKTTISLENPTAEFIYTDKNHKYVVTPYSKLNNSILSGYKTYYDKFKKIMTSMSDKVIVKEL